MRLNYNVAFWILLYMLASSLVLGKVASNFFEGNEFWASIILGAINGIVLSYYTWNKIWTTED